MVSLTLSPGALGTVIERDRNNGVTIRCSLRCQLRQLQRSQGRTTGLFGEVGGYEPTEGPISKGGDNPKFRISNRPLHCFTYA